MGLSACRSTTRKGNARAASGVPVEESPLRASRLRYSVGGVSAMNMSRRWVFMHWARNGRP
eukprot:6598413-Lingulodinium_polyedra.AAC.1